VASPESSPTATTTDTAKQPPDKKPAGDPKPAAGATDKHDGSQAPPPTPSGHRGSAPFTPLGRDASKSPAEDLVAGLDGTTIPPIQALTPMSGLDFGAGFQVGPVMALVDAFGLVALLWVVRRYGGAADEGR
jgi:hypothetical protein